MYNYKQHPLSARFPPMDRGDFRRFCEDIRVNGLMFPIMLFAGMILDGWHRYFACQKTGVTPRFEEFNGDLADACKYVCSANHHRRHAKPAQIAMTAAEFATVGHGGHRGTAQKQKIALEAMTIAEASEAFGVNAAYIKDARVILQSGDDALIAEVKKGKKQLTVAAKEVRNRRAEQARTKKATHQSEKPAPGPGPGATADQTGAGLKAGDADDDDSTGDLGGSPPPAVNAAVRPLTVAEQAGNVETAGAFTAAENGSAPESRASSHEPPGTTVETANASNHPNDLGSGTGTGEHASGRAAEAAEAPPSGAESSENTARSVDSSKVADGASNEFATDDPVDPRSGMQIADTEPGRDTAEPEAGPIAGDGDAVPVSALRTEPASSDGEADGQAAASQHDSDARAAAFRVATPLDPTADPRGESNQPRSIVFVELLNAPPEGDIDKLPPEDWEEIRRSFRELRAVLDRCPSNLKISVCPNG
jgi:uncharacterized short protein YbdD (DUF466 family)